LTSDGTAQTSSFNKQNEITGISGLTTPGYDSDGNMTTDQTGKTLVYDAWNRLVDVKSGTTILVAYTFDALSRRVTENPGTLRSLYYSAQWQVLEEQSSGTTLAQYVWSPVYVDALVERDRSSERLYVQQSANWDVTALVDTSGNIVERNAYDPYGQVTILAPNWSARGSSSYAWVYLHQGNRFDSISSLYQVRERDYSPALGRWMQIDPIRYKAHDVNLYDYLFADPLRFTDPFGKPPAFVAAVGVIAILAACSYQHFVYLNNQHLVQWNNAKWAHCVASCRIAKTCGAGPSAFMGISKEILDEIMFRFGLSPEGFDTEDLKADLVGIKCAGWETRIGPLAGWIGACFRQDCASCCDKHFSRWK
jgi:RHS repeat-associated protein